MIQVTDCALRHNKAFMLLAVAYNKQVVLLENGKILY